MQRLIIILELLIKNKEKQIIKTLRNRGDVLKGGIFDLADGLACFGAHVKNLARARSRHGLWRGAQDSARA